MCFSEKASLTTLLIGLISSALVFSLGKPNDKLWGLFFAFVSLMQLIEVLLWRHQTCDRYNQIVSFMGKFFNLMQPVVLFLLVMYFRKPTETKSLYVLVALYLAFVVFANNWNPSQQQCIVKGSDNHLHYPWSTLVSHLIFVVALTGVAYLAGCKTAPWVILLSYLVSYIFYGPVNLVGEMWCILTVFIPLLYYSVHKMNI